MLSSELLKKLFPYLNNEIVNMEIKDYKKSKEVLLEYKNGDKYVGDLNAPTLQLRKLEGLTSIAEYFARGKYGDNSWRGNCSGLLIRDLLQFYKPKSFCDPMCGSGTSISVAKDLNLNVCAMDLNPKFGGFNVLSDEFPKAFDFMFLHPPYFVFEGSKMPVYSGKMWGDMPHPSDGSHIHNKEKFTKWFNEALFRSYQALKKGGRMAVLMGDSRFKSDYYSMFKSMNIYGKLENVIIKKQFNCMSDNINYKRNFIPIAHEYLVVIKKEQECIIPCLIVSEKEFSIFQTTKITWRSLIQSIIEKFGGKASREQIYNEAKKSKKAARNNNVEAKVRQIINSFPQQFIKKDNFVQLAM